MKNIVQLILSFFKIGIFNFGGGMAMIPLILEELERNNWMTQEVFFNFFSLAQITPGAIAMNTASYIGVSVAGVPGAIIATASLATPSVAVMLVLSGFLTRVKEHRVKEAIFSGLKAVTVALILFAGYQIARSTFLVEATAGFSYKAILLCAACLVVVFTFEKIHPILLIVLSAIIGVIWF